MAMACLRLVTFLPLRPLLSVPFFLRRIALATVLLAPLLYFLAMSRSPLSTAFTSFIVGAEGPRYGPPDPPVRGHPIRGRPPSLEPVVGGVVGAGGPDMAPQTPHSA